MFAFPIPFDGSFEVFTSFEGIDRLFFIIEASEIPTACFAVNSACDGEGLARCCFIAGSPDGRCFRTGSRLNRLQYDFDIRSTFNLTDIGKGGDSF